MLTPYDTGKRKIVRQLEVFVFDPHTQQGFTANQITALQKNQTEFKLQWLLSNLPTLVTLGYEPGSVIKFMGNYNNPKTLEQLTATLEREKAENPAFFPVVPVSVTTSSQSPLTAQSNVSDDIVHSHDSGSMQQEDDNDNDEDNDEDIDEDNDEDNDDGRDMQDDMQLVQDEQGIQHQQENDEIMEELVEMDAKGNVFTTLTPTEDGIEALTLAIQTQGKYLAFSKLRWTPTDNLWAGSIITNGSSPKH